MPTRINLDGGSSLEMAAIPYSREETMYTQAVNPQSLRAAPQASMPSRIFRILAKRPDILITLALGLIVLICSVMSVVVNRAKHAKLQGEITRIEQRLDSHPAASHH
jgi:hypothetical protein